MTEGFRKLTPEQAVEMGKLYPFVEVEGDDDDTYCNVEADVDEGYFECTLRPGHPGMLHLAYFSESFAGVSGANDKYVPLYQWFS